MIFPKDLPNKMDEEEMSIRQKEWVIGGGRVRPLGKYLGGSAVAFIAEGDDGDWYCENRMYAYVEGTWTKLRSNPQASCSCTCLELCHEWVARRGFA